MKIDEKLVEKVLARQIQRISVTKPLLTLGGKRILITGADGAIGSALTTLLKEKYTGFVVATDIHSLDVRNRWKVGLKIAENEPDVIFHLAGAKHAPAGELDPVGVTETNITGTVNVVEEAKSRGIKVVLASTCKACDPETAYGASKLIAERVVLGSGGSVARFYNVVETSGNVFETWSDVVAPEPLMVTGCVRYFISVQEATALLLWSAVLPSGRYAVDPGKPRSMWCIAEDFRPGAERRWMSPRRGDRLNEKLIGSSERIERVNNWLMKITSPHEEDL